MKSPLDQHIGRRLKAIRTLTGIKRTELSELIGIASQQINKYENGTNRIPASRLYEISQILEKPISIFFEGYIDDQYYNFEFQEEESLLEFEEARNKELNNLIIAFNRIKDDEVRKSVIGLLNSLGGY